MELSTKLDCKLSVTCSMLSPPKKKHIQFKIVHVCVFFGSNQSYPSMFVDVCARKKGATEVILQPKSHPTAKAQIQPQYNQNNPTSKVH